MTFLPIVARELRIASRRRSTYWVRAGAGLFVIIGGAWMFLVTQTQAPRDIAQELFGVLTGSALIFSIFSGLRSTADCISEEKREGTLGLLFLTDLKGYDVVLGKLVANSINVFYGLLAVLPMFGIPLLLGGISPAQFGRTALVVVNTMLLSLCIGIFTSALGRIAQQSLSMAFFLILIIIGGCPALGGWLMFVRKSPQFEPWLFLPSPAYGYYLAWDIPHKGMELIFWYSMAVIHALAWFFLLLASLILPHRWQDRPASVVRLRWRERWLSWAYGDATERRKYRARLLDSNAFYWLAARARFRPALVWGVLGLLAVAWLWGYVKFKGDWLNVGTYIATGVVLNVLLKGWFASESVRQIADERKTGALELLLSTPLTVRDILQGQLLALVRQFLGPVLLALTLGLVFMMAPAHELFEREDRIFWAAYWLAAMLVFVADLAALYWVGMWHALTSRNPNRAVSASLGRIWALPWIIYALCGLVFALGSMLTGAHDPSWKVVLAVFVLVSLAIDLGFALRARHKLLTLFRVAAIQRFAQKRTKKSAEQTYA